MNTRVPTSVVRASALFAVLLAACNDADPLTPRDEDGDPPQSEARVVYSTFEPATGRWGVATADLDGSDAAPIPFSPANPGGLPDLVFFEFQWSPDGGSLLFRSTRTNTDDWALGLVDRDGSRKRYLTHPDGFAISARWSPRGDEILYDRGGLLGDQLGIAYQTAIADTSGSTRDFFVEGDGEVFEGERVHFSLISFADSSLFEVVPAVYEAHFAPDGDLYVLGSVGRPLWASDRRPRDAELFRVSSTTGRVLERLTRNGIDEGGFQLSPDGSTILLSLPRQGSSLDRRLYVMPVRGGTVLARVTDGFHDQPARWASDSRHVTFMRPEDGETRIYVVDVESGGPERLVLSGGVQPDLHFF